MSFEEAPPALIPLRGANIDGHTARSPQGCRVMRLAIFFGGLSTTRGESGTGDKSESTEAFIVNLSVLSRYTRERH
jgi:hypothetical protein